MVYICLASDESVVCEEFGFKGKREEIKLQASEAALEMIKKHVQALSES